MGDTMDGKVRAVIFDIGGVITRFPDSEYFTYLANLGGKKPGFVRRVIGAEIPRLERGGMRISEFERTVSRKVGISPKDVQWYQYYAKFVTIDTDMTDLIEQLHKDYVTAYITNIDSSKYMLFKKMLGKEMFDYRFASCDLHLRKPDPRIYRTVLARMGLSPGESVFIDNQIENVVGAREVGMYSILYKSRRRLDIELSKILE